MSSPRVSTCPECSRLIHWVKCPFGLVPLDAKPQTGLFEILDGKGRLVKAHTNHLDTCPKKIGESK